MFLKGSAGFHLRIDSAETQMAGFRADLRATDKGKGALLDVVPALNRPAQGRVTIDVIKGTVVVQKLAIYLGAK